MTNNRSLVLWFLSCGLVFLLPTTARLAEAPAVSGSPATDPPGQPLVEAVWTGADVDELQALLNKGLDINSPGRGGLTAWQAARLHGRIDVTEFLARKGADTRTAAPAPEKLADALLQRWVHTNDAGAAVLVAQNGKILFQRGYGLADQEHGIPVTPETKFRIGSVSKQFTASAILKLHEEGKLSLDDKLSKFIPDFPRGQEVTLRHLLTHTSGIHSYTGKKEFGERVTQPVRASEVIDWFKHDPYDFDPGKKWLYNNSGYFLLGFIVEKVSGMEYEAFLRRAFFKPLAMNDTGVHRSNQALTREALGYQFQDGKFVRAKNWDMSWAGGAGALYSTVGDLYRWNEGIFEGKVLAASSRSAAFTPVKIVGNAQSESKAGYGFGWGIAAFRGTQEISHGGGLDGFSSLLLRLPQEHFTVAVLLNAAPVRPGTEPGRLAHDLVEFFLGTKLEPRPALKVDRGLSPKALEGIVGRYDYGAAILTVSREGGRVFAQLAGQQRYEIFPKSETNFFWRVVDAEVTFVKDGKGKVTKAIHHQAGQTLEAPRIE